MFKRIVQIMLGVGVAWTATALPARAQNGQPMDTAMDAPGWHFMQDAVAFSVFNHQGSPRGGDEFKAPNWWMGMFSRKLKGSQLTVNTMFSLDPATVGEGGYREIFQAGEALNGKPLIDHQHPHDFFMQLAVAWRFAVTDKTGFTIAGGPVGEPAIGPVAFMHRASAAENPFAPLSHHTFDSSHIAFGVVTAAVDHGPWVAEGSVFNGREPDQHRWDFDLGALDSFSGRLWFKPSTEWEFQVSSARLKHPEELDPGNITRTTASASWFKQSGRDFSAVMVGFGVNATAAMNRHALFAEGTMHKGSNSLFSRFELVDVETDALLNDAVPTGAAARLKNAVVAFTVGGVRDVFHSGGFEGGLGAGLTFYGAPDALKAPYGSHPVSFQVFFRLRPPTDSMGRMFNMRMSQPMLGMSNHQMDHSTMDHGQMNQAEMREMSAKPASTQGGLTITLTSPAPRAEVGNNWFDVLVNDAAGKPLDDADVSALFVMPAMPGMSAMRNGVKLASAGNGTFSGTARVMMAGDWHVTIVVRQNGRELGRKQLVLNAQSHVKEKR